MGPQKYASVRHKSRSTAALVSFLDDSCLVALPYDQTIQAEPPIPIIPTRNPTRYSVASSASSATSSSSARLAAQQLAQQHYRQQQQQQQQPQVLATRPHSAFSPSTVVVVAPQIAPPREQHPALRDGAARGIILEESWKRDSGLARTASSAATIVEEDEKANGEDGVEGCADDDACEDGTLDQEERRRRRRRNRTDRGRPAVRSSSVFPLTSPPMLPPPMETDGSRGGENNTATVAVAAPANAMSPLAAEEQDQGSDVSSPRSGRVALSAEKVASPPAPPPPPDSPTNRLVKSFSFRSGSSLKKTKKTMGPSELSLVSGRGRGSTSGSTTAAAAAAAATATAIATPAVQVPRPGPQQHPHPHHQHRPGQMGGPASPTPSSKTSTTVATTATAATTAFSFTQALSATTTPQSQSAAGSIYGSISRSSAKAARSPTRFFSRSSKAGAAPRSPTIAPPLVDPGHEFLPISVTIPTETLLDDDFITNLTFSNRGSVMLSGKKMVMRPEQAGMEADPRPAPHLSEQTQQQEEDPCRDPAAPEISHDASSATASSPLPSASPHDTAEGLSRDSISRTDRNDAATGRDSVASSSYRGPSAGPSLAPPNILILPAETERESQNVRSLYEHGEGGESPDSYARPDSFIDRLSPMAEDPREDMDNDPPHHIIGTTLDTPRSASSHYPHRDSPLRKEHELAGGIEDWENVSGADVDRYGFIAPRRLDSRCGTPTELKPGQFTPGGGRRRNVLSKRDLTGRTPSRKVSARSLNTQHSEMSTTSRRSSRSAFRQASNMLPHNRDRRWMDEAGEMLSTAPVGDLREEAEMEKISEALKKKEWERTEKWRRMAKVVNKQGRSGQGMDFEFDTRNPKLVDRTWKGIPDRWRAAAWYSFLRSSARDRPECATEDDIVQDFHRLQDRSSPDDMQIDLDVPRTINRHIMFRRRYRGGQRLLFRVLHAVSIYFPQTGYVQGMASLAATLLCYFDEEKCFVMIVRIWQLRGLEALYRPGFEGLMVALRDFETKWLGGKDVAKKVAELNIDPTAYGARWYLTLFNLAIPFAAQLRVWDVFLLLGGGDPDSTPDEPAGTSTAKTSMGSRTGPAPSPIPPSPVLPVPATSSPSSSTGLDVLHATSAALMHALSDVLLDSDFENAMKALTSWIPIKDEELLMKVARAEWKLHRGKKRG